MAALESLAISFFHLSSSPSPNPPLLTPATSRLSSFPIFTPKLSHKSHSHPFTISGKFQVCSSSSSSSSTTLEEVSEKNQKEILHKRLFVLNLPWSFSVDELKNLFSEGGNVEEAQIITRKKDGKSRGYAFVTMSSREEALAVIDKYDSYELMGRIIRVEFAKDVKKSSPLTPTPTPGEKPSKLYVSNLEWKVRSKDLREFFAADFNPISTRVVFETPSGRSAGYGFVTFASKEEAESAISSLDGKELLGRPISLTFSERNADKAETEEDDSSDRQPAES